MDDPPDEMDDDLYDDMPPPTGPSPNQLRKEAAERGDVDFFLDIVRTERWGWFSLGEILRHLMRAAEVRARSDPEGYARDLFGMMVGFNSFLLMRTQIYVADRVVGRGPHHASPMLADLSVDVVERLLPRLAEHQRGLAEILVAQAQAERLWGLARAKEARAEGAASANREGARRARSSGGTSGRAGSRAAKAKAEGPRDGVVPLPAGGRRRG